MIYDGGKQSFGETQYRLPVSLSAMNIMGLDQYQALFLHVDHNVPPADIPKVPRRRGRSVVDRNRREKIARIAYLKTLMEKAREWHFCYPCMKLSARKISWESEMGTSFTTMIINITSS